MIIFVSYAEKIAQWVKLLPLKLEDLPSNPCNTHKAECRVSHIHNLSDSVVKRKNK